MVLRMEAVQGVGVITRVSGITPHPYASMYLLSYEVLWTKMHKDASASRRPILGTSVPLGSPKKAPLCGASSIPVLVVQSYGYKTRIGLWQTSRFALASPQIDVSRRRTEGFALATRAARCSLRSHSPLLPWRRLYRYNRRWRVTSTTGSAGSRFARHAVDRWSLPTVGTGSGVTSRWQMSLPDELARYARFVRRSPLRRSKKLYPSLPNRRGR